MVGGWVDGYSTSIKPSRSPLSNPPTTHLPLPIQVGYFSLNVPSGLGVYWIANNIITTLTTVAVRAVIDKKGDTALVSPTSSSSSSSSTEMDAAELSRRGFGNAPPNNVKLPPPPPPRVSIHSLSHELV